MGINKMKIFISHASRNQEVVLKFAEFLEQISSDIEVFCSSEKGSIATGSNFVKKVFDELNSCDLFLPILSKEYFESKFCMIELGVAYSWFYTKYEEQGEDYIFPFALLPLQKGQALSGTPMANIQTGNISDEDDIHRFLEYLSTEKGVNVRTGTNRKLHSFKYELERLLIKEQNLVRMARVGAYFDESIEYQHRKDIADISIQDDSIVLNYNMNPYEKKDVRYPKFVSVALRYVDDLDVGRYLDFNNAAEFCFSITSFTNSLRKIFVEFKYSDNNKILDTFEFEVGFGKTDYRIPLDKMQSKALSHISEICFVIHPDDVVEEEGMFKIDGIGIRM